jgi:hypothetical protein
MMKNSGEVAGGGITGESFGYQWQPEEEMEHRDAAGKVT